MGDSQLVINQAAGCTDDGGLSETSAWEKGNSASALYEDMDPPDWQIDSADDDESCLGLVESAYKGVQICNV